MQDKVIVIVGATGGIGSTLTQKLVETKAKLVLVARDSDRLAALAAQFPAAANQVLTLSIDITQPEQVEALMQSTITQFGKIDVLVNTAGVGILKQYKDLRPTDLDYLLNVNLKGSFYTCQAAANVMKEGKSGHICNVVGILGKNPMQWHQHTVPLSMVL